MRNKLYGYTVAEVLISLTIVGIIIALTFVQIKPFDNKMSLYVYNVYESLTLANKVIMSQKRNSVSPDLVNEFGLGLMSFYAPITSGESKPKNDVKYEYCNDLSKILNITGNTKCNWESINIYDNKDFHLNEEIIKKLNKPSFTTINKISFIFSTKYKDYLQNANKEEYNPPDYTEDINNYTSQMKEMMTNPDKDVLEPCLVNSRPYLFWYDSRNNTSKQRTAVYNYCRNTPKNCEVCIGEECRYVLNPNDTINSIDPNLNKGKTSAIHTKNDLWSIKAYLMLRKLQYIESFNNNSIHNDSPYGLPVKYWCNTCESLMEAYLENVQVVKNIISDLEALQEASNNYEPEVKPLPYEEEINVAKQTKYLLGNSIVTIGVKVLAKDKFQLNKNVFSFEILPNGVVLPMDYLANNQNTPLKFNVFDASKLSITKPLTYCEAVRFAGGFVTSYTGCEGIEIEDDIYYKYHEPEENYYPPNKVTNIKAGYCRTHFCRIEAIKISSDARL